MAWGYWSATSVSDRGRSPRRDKDKQNAQHATLRYRDTATLGNNIQLQQQQQQQQQQEQSQQQTELQQIVVEQHSQHPAQGSTAGITLSNNEPLSQGGGCSSLRMQQIQAELAAAAEVPSQSSSSFYPYATLGRPETLPRTSTTTTTSNATVATCTYPPSPVESDSVDYEQPGSSAMNSFCVEEEEEDEEVLDGGGPGLIHTSSRMKLLRDDDDIIEGLSDPEFEELASAEVMYDRWRMDQPGPSGGCLVHGIPITRRVPPDPSPPLPPLLMESERQMQQQQQQHQHHHQQTTGGEPQFWFDDITWGRSSACWDHDHYGDYIYVAMLAI